MHIELVRQKHLYGCVPAVCSMITRIPYDTVVNCFSNDFDAQGVSTELMTQFLGDHGFSIISKVLEYYNRMDLFRDEMLKPFADVHVICTMATIDCEWGHVSVMDCHGTIFDPDGATREQIIASYKMPVVFGIFQR